MTTLSTAAFATANNLSLERSNPQHFTLGGQSGLPLYESGDDNSFEQAFMKAIDGVNAGQQKVAGLEQELATNPEAVNAHDLTIAQAEASLSLNLANTLLSRTVTAWKDIINTR